MISVDALIDIAFPGVRAEMLRGKDWYSPELRHLAENGKLRLTDLGAFVAIPGWRGEDHKIYDVKEVNIPLCWTEEDDELDEVEKINLVTNLFSNGFQAHDNMIEQLIGRGIAYASKTYRYEKGETMGDGKGNFMFKLYTAICFIPEGE